MFCLGKWWEGCYCEARGNISFVTDVVNQLLSSWSIELPQRPSSRFLWSSQLCNLLYFFVFSCLSGLWAGRPFRADGQSRRPDEAAQRHYRLRLLTPDTGQAQPSALVQSGNLLQALMSPAVHMQQVNLSLKTPLWNQTYICAGLSLFGFYWSQVVSTIWDRDSIEGN